MTSTLAEHDREESKTVKFEMTKDAQDWTLIAVE